jgi:YjjG family noncanonical pyrimidine nucleotidase
MTALPKAVLFDLDDTLLDHQHASACALRELRDRYAAGITFEALAAEHARVVEKYHLRFLNGELTLDAARVARMVEMFAAFGKAVSEEKAMEVALSYRELHQANRRLVAGAGELLDALHGRTKLAIVTNNSATEQWDKLRYLGIADRFDAVLISEEVGITKPNRAIFDAALSRLDCAQGDAVMVGDNWEADVMGARAAGIAAIWFNRFKQPRRAPVPAAEIDALAPPHVVMKAMEQAMHETSHKGKEHGKLEQLAS